MANIELVIKIPESQYKTLTAKTQEDVVDVIDDKTLIDAIKDGVPLPKGHGRLIDADDLEHITVCCKTRNSGITRIEAPTIIEADTESEGKNEQS